MAKRNSNGGATAPIPFRNDVSSDRPALTIKTDDKGRIFSHIRQKWLVETLEERVRQAYIVTLHNENGFPT